MQILEVYTLIDIRKKQNESQFNHFDNFKI